MEFLARLEALPLSTWVRESPSLLAYPTILFLHTAGLAIVVGISAADALRALTGGFDMPSRDRVTLRRALWFGFFVNATSGLLLLVADATTKLVNPVFFIKIVCIVAAMFVTLRLQRHALSSPAGQPSRLRGLAFATLLFWIAAITAGRFMAYFGPVSGVARLATPGH